MANMKINGFDGVDKLFLDLSDPNEIAIEAVDKAAPILEEAMRSAIAASASKGYGTGELAASVGALPAKKNKLGVFAVVRPMGEHSGGESNAKLASILEYGRRGGYKRDGKTVTTQAPAPFRAKAVNAAKEKCEEIMRQTVEQRMGCE